MTFVRLVLKAVTSRIRVGKVSVTAARNKVTMFAVNTDREHDHRCRCRRCRDLAIMVRFDNLLSTADLLSVPFFIVRRSEPETDRTRKSEKESWILPNPRNPSLPATEDPDGVHLFFFWFRRNRGATHTGSVRWIANHMSLFSSEMEITSILHICLHHLGSCDSCWSSARPITVPVGSIAGFARATAVFFTVCRRIRSSASWR